MTTERFPSATPPEEIAAFAAELSDETPELDLHGQTRNDALRLLDAELHHQFMQGSEAIRVIHGRGDGVLRRAVQDHARKQTEVVALVRDAETPGQQGGATIIVLHSRNPR